MQKATLRIGFWRIFCDFLWVEITVPWTWDISDLKWKEIVGTFYKKELQKINQKEFRVEKLVKRKDGKLYVKWKGYNNWFNDWIDK